MNSSFGKLIAPLILPWFIQTAAHASLDISGNVTPIPANALNDFFVGNSTDGNLSINNGSMLENANGRIGNQAGSHGSVIVTDPDSSWANSEELFVGSYGMGSLSIRNQGLVANTNGKIGDQTGSHGNVTISGSNSHWQNSAELFIGSFGTGILTIESGGSVHNTNGKIGDQALSSGSVRISGARSTWANSTELFVGSYGSGSLEILNGATVSSTNGKIGDQLGSDGEVTVSGHNSNWTNTAELFVGQLGTASLTIENQGEVNVTDVGRVGELGTLNLGQGNLAAQTLFLNGLLNIQIDELGTGNMFIDATAELGGSLEISLSDSYIPTIGDSFIFLQAMNITGSFDDFILPEIEGFQFDLIFDHNVAKIEVNGIPAVPTPAATWLFGTGLIGLIAARKRR